MLVMPVGMTAEIKLVQNENAPSFGKTPPPPICVTLSGIITAVRAEHPENAPLPILVTPSEISTEVRPEQLSNA